MVWNDNFGVHACLSSFVQQDPKQLSVEKRFMAAALKNVRSMKSWHTGICGDFWFVGRDYGGSYVIPDKNKSFVYKIVGISRGAINGGRAYKKADEPLSLSQIPFAMPITVVPWCGRLLYDTTVMAPPLHLKRADTEMAHQLQEQVLKAIQKSRVIEYFADLEEQ